MAGLAGSDPQADSEMGLLGLQMALGSSHPTLRLRVGRAEQGRPHPKGAPERLELAGEDLTATADLADAALLIPHHLAGHRPKGAPMTCSIPAQDILSRSRGHHHSSDQPRIAGYTHHRPQHRPVRSYRGGASEPDTARTVLRATPNLLAIVLIPNPLQPTNRGPILHVDQSPILPAGIQPGSHI